MVRSHVANTTSTKAASGILYVAAFVGGSTALNGNTSEIIRLIEYGLERHHRFSAVVDISGS
jgi:hypothetical protein